MHCLRKHLCIYQHFFPGLQRSHLAPSANPAGFGFDNCAEICPKQALIFGKRDDLLEIARLRISVNPGKYYEDRVYGEFEGGGTSVLILSAVPFEAIGLPALDQKPLPDRTQWALNIVPVIFFGVGGLMSAIYQRTKQQAPRKEEEE